MSPAETKPHRIVFALTSSDEADWKLLLGTFATCSAPDSVETELVVYGPGRAFVPDSSSASVPADLMLLETQGLACDEAMLTGEPMQ